MFKTVKYLFFNNTVFRTSLSIFSLSLLFLAFKVVSFKQTQSSNKRPVSSSVSQHPVSQKPSLPTVPNISQKTAPSYPLPVKPQVDSIKVESSTMNKPEEDAKRVKPSHNLSEIPADPPKTESSTMNISADKIIPSHPLPVKPEVDPLKIESSTMNKPEEDAKRVKPSHNLNEIPADPPKTESSTMNISADKIIPSHPLPVKPEVDPLKIESSTMNKPEEDAKRVKPSHNLNEIPADLQKTEDVTIMMHEEEAKRSNEIHADQQDSHSGIENKSGTVNNSSNGDEQSSHPTPEKRKKSSTETSDQVLEVLKNTKNDVIKQTEKGIKRSVRKKLREIEKSINK